MKPSVWLLLSWSLVLMATSVCQASQSRIPNRPSTHVKARSSTERLVARVDNWQKKFVELQCEVQEHRQQVTLIREDHDKMLSDILTTIHRLDARLGDGFECFSDSFGLMQNQTLEILAKQTERTSHEARPTTQPRPKQKPTTPQIKGRVTASTRLQEDPEVKTTPTSSPNERFITTTVSTIVKQGGEEPVTKQSQNSATTSSGHPQDPSASTISQQSSDIATTGPTPNANVNGTGSIPVEQDSEKPSSKHTETHSGTTESVTSASQLPEDPSETTTSQQENMLTIPKFEGSGWDVSFTDCKDEPSKISGPYLIRCINDCEPFTAYCEQQAFGGGWLVVQYRFDGSLDFQRNWTEYRDGFGDINKEFWIGLEKLHQLTSSHPYELVVEIKDFQGNYAYARYEKFEIGDKDDQYHIKTLEEYSGSAGDSMAYHRGMKFSTWDRDNDESDENCAKKYGGAWWYNDCHNAHLNGRYMNARNASAIGWYTFKNSNQGLSFSRMMIRPSELPLWGPVY